MPAPVHLHRTGVWYSVATAALSADATLEATLHRDFDTIRLLTISAVYVEHIEPAQWPAVLNAAASRRLSIIAADERALHYVRTGAEPERPFSPTVPDHPLVVERYIGHVVDAVTLQRARRVAQLAKERAPPLAVCVTVEEGAPLTAADMLMFDQIIVAHGQDVRGSAESMPAGGVATVECAQHRRDELATVRRWLAGFHAALLHGCTGGVVFDRYRAIPGNWRGIAYGGEPLSAERKAMIKRICLRAQEWSPLLAGLRAAPIEIGAGKAERVVAAAFSASAPRYLMIANLSPDVFARTTMAIPSVLDGVELRRAVAVTPPERAEVGQVYSARRGEISIRVDLAPGDAMLVELF